MVNKENGGSVPQELETFLPSDGTNGAVKYKITPAKDVETTNTGSFNPFFERKVDHPTTDMQTLTHLLKASLGTGILAMPLAFSHTGIVIGILSTLFTAFVCTHCAYVLVKCAHTLYHRTHRTVMSFSEVSEVAFANGPPWGRKFSSFSKYFIQYGLFLTYFGTCSSYTVITAENFKQVIDYYTGGQIPIRILIASLLIPLVLLSWIPNLKYLAPISMIANVFMGVGLGITFYYLAIKMPSAEEASEKLFLDSYWTMPTFFAISIFAMEAIGVVMPLENQMRTPQNFVGLCGVLNRGMSGVTLIYMFLGIFGYLGYGENTKASITLNLKESEIPAQIVKVLIGLAVYCTYGLQFFVCLDIGWTLIKDKFVKRPTIANYVMRTILVSAATLLAVAIPTIAPFIGLIGAFCFSILGLLVPVFIETVTYWDQGFGKYNWVVWKNVLVCIFGLIALIFGSKAALIDIANLYTTNEIVNATSTTESIILAATIPTLAP